jgi:hypothetical protein
MAEAAEIDIGTRREGHQAVALPAAGLLRHLFAVGASGSGKTVFCKNVVERAAEAGIPAICVDPQGDLASVALAGGELAKKIDPVIFTPASTAGIAVCADPIRGDAGEDVTRWATRAARLLVSALGYDLGADDGDGLSVAFASLLERHRGAGGEPALASFLAAVAGLIDRCGDELSALVSGRALTAASRRLRRLDAPGRRALFAEGRPLDVDALLEGAGDRARIAVIYLNALDTQEDKELVVATLVDRLYRWMLSRPSSEPQLLFYIDEVAPYLPPVRKPACKEGLVLLLKQARKYGVGCLVATQNPGDIDYRALGQLGSWAVGRLVTRQDLKKIEPSIASLAGPDAPAVMRDLPRLGPGEFWLLSPDHFDAPVDLVGRRLDAPHETLDLARVKELADERWRDRFPETATATETATETETETEAETEAETGAATEAATEAEAVTEAATGTATALAARIEAALAGTEGLRAVALAELLGFSEGHVRKILRGLVDRGHAAKVRRGREVHYIWIAGGGRADLELGAEITSARRSLPIERAASIAEGYIRSRLFGLLGDREHLAGVDPIAHPLYAVDYTEPVRPGRLERLLGQRRSHLEGTVYFEPASLELLHYHPGSGIRFAEPTSDSPTAVDDLDGQVELGAAPLDGLSLDEARWLRRRPVTEVEARFHELFAGQVTGVRAVFLPLWRVRYHQSGGGAVRVLFIDAIRGHPVEWPH